MKRTILLACASIAFGSSLADAQSGAQGNASVQSQSSVSAGQSGASASNRSSGSASASSNQASAALAGGSEIDATLSKPVDARKNKPGDEVTATAAKDVKSGGHVVIPKGSKLIGHVTSARARGAKNSSGSSAGSTNASGSAAGEAASHLGIVFDKAILRDGREIPLNATIQALAAGDAAASSGSRSADAMLSGTGNAAASARSSGGGLVGGAVSGAGGTLSGVTNTAANVGGSVSSTVTHKSAGAVGGLNAAGQLTSGSRGVFGMKGLDVQAASSGNAEGSLVTSTTRNVRLDGGTRMLLVSGAQAAGSTSAASDPSENSGNAVDSPRREPADRR